jgi:hypothetical protein
MANYQDQTAQPGVRLLLWEATSKVGALNPLRENTTADVPLLPNKSLIPTQPQRPNQTVQRTAPPLRRVTLVQLDHSNIWSQHHRVTDHAEQPYARA